MQLDNGFEKDNSDDDDRARRNSFLDILSGPSKHFKAVEVCSHMLCVSFNPKRIESEHPDQCSEEFKRLP